MGISPPDRNLALSPLMVSRVGCASSLALRFCTIMLSWASSSDERMGRPIRKGELGGASVQETASLQSTPVLPDSVRLTSSTLTRTATISGRR
ncbi:hypothetical protein D3C72_2264740 [compost metagenome]